MDDLLDLNWVDSNTKQNTPSPSTAKEGPKDAFADLLSKPTKKPVDISKLSLLERQKLQQQEQSKSLASWKTTPPSATTSHNSTTPLSPSIIPLTATPSPTVLSNNSNPSTVKKPNSFVNNDDKGSSFDNLMNSFPLNVSKNRTQDRNTPLNQLRNVYTPDSSHESNWDFDLLDSKLTSIPVSTTNSTATPTSHADPFEVEALTQNETFDLRYSTDQDDNPLGILAQPANVLTNQNKDEVKPDNNLEAVEHIQDTPNESTLPPNEDDEDAKLAQLIEMGFSLQQSKFALEATLGQDIQAAINLLVQNSETAQRLQPNQSDNRRPIVQNERTRNAESHAQQPEMRREVGSRPSGKNDDNIQIQTEKLVMQAQELGGFLYKNAASYFKASRDKVTKAVGDWQEQQRTQRLEEHKGPIRPKWMTGDNDTVDLSTGSVERFKDDDDDAEAEMSSRMAERRRVEEIERQKKIKQRETAAIAHKARQQQQLKKDLLFDDDQTTYVSPSRRRAATPKNDGSMSPSFSNGSPNKTSLPLSQKPAPEITSPKANRPTRPIINVPADVLTKANNFRNSGNEKFKIGQFGEAEAAYSEAINVLPSGYDLQILLYNNRAATRLKNGDYKKCIEDCDLAFELCKQNGDGSVVIENIDIQYRDQLVKSLYRKAEALENIEKYNDALATCELLIKYEGTSNSNINQRMSRCRQALNPKSISKPKNTSPQVPKSQKPGDLMAMFDPTAASSNPPSLVVSEEELSKSKAVTAMRAKAAEKEAEDAEKLQKVDDVNARILAWKAGKEQNLRALLATLDSLLWPGAQWKGAQMSELINPKKCKITYMKAISKVHPDKLPADTSVENRMLASAIFSSLNEAWDSFKEQNQL